MTITDESTVTRLRQHAAMPSQFLSDGIYAEVVGLCDSHESLRQQLADLRAMVATLQQDRDWLAAYAGQSITRSDYKTADAMRAELERVRAELDEVIGKAQQLDTDWSDDAQTMDELAEIIERLSAELTDVTAERDALDSGQGHTQARDLLRDIAQRHGVATVDPETGVEMSAYELACEIGGVLTDVTDDRDRLLSHSEPADVVESYRSIVNEWVGTLVTIGKYEAVHPVTVRKMMASISGCGLIEWARWLVWWHGHHLQQLETQEQWLHEEGNARREAEAERDRLRQFARRQAEEIESLNDMADAVEVLRDIGKVIGCGHVDGPDERRQLVNCIEQEFTRVTAERDRLRAELLQQPPTLEWLRATFGGQPEVAAGSTGYNVYRWSCGVKYRDPHGQVSCPPGVLKRTRAAVLEAVAATKETNDGK